MTDEIIRLCSDLGITEAQLARLRIEYRKKHEDQADEKLLAWLRVTWVTVRPRRWLLSRRSVPPYTESPSEAMPSDAGEGVPPDEIESYRHTVQARARFAKEQHERVADLLGACQEVRAAAAGLDEDMKKVIGRELWTLRSRIDALERKLKRKLAA